MAKQNTQDPSQMKRGLPHYYALLNQVNGMRKAFLKEKDVAMWLMFGIVKRYLKEVIKTAEEDGPMVATWYGNAPEVPAAMGIVQTGPGEMMIQYSDENVKLARQSQTPGNSCGLLRIAAVTVEKGLTPTPKATIAMLEPCDGQTTTSEMWLRTPEWKDMPMFGLDAPYGNTEEDIEYFAGELRRLIAFLEETCDVKMTEENLRRVCEEGNKQYALWKQICEQQAAVPAPMPGMAIAQAVPALTQHLFIGDKPTTRFLKLFSMVSAGNVKKGKGTVPEEKIRCAWLDIPYSEGDAYTEWLADTYGAVVVASTWGEGNHYTPIDTTNMDTMLHDIAKRSMMDASMIRESRSTVDQFIEDVRFIVKFYKIDCVIFPGHKGHKDMPATVGFLRDVCRDLDVALLELNCDLVDPYYKGLDEVKTTTAQFFETQGWEKINEN